jgi:hypothetical protein
VGVHRPGVRTLDTAHERTRRWRRCGPQPEGAVDVQPGAVRGTRLRDGFERVERASCDVAGLGTDDRRPAPPGQGGGELDGVHAALVVGADPDGGVRAQAELPQCCEDGGVCLLAAHDVHAGAAGQSMALDVPAGAGEHSAPCGGERGGVRGLPARHEADARARRQAEEVEDPLGGDLLDGRGRRGERVERGILVPCGDQPVGCQSGRQGSADDEAEVPRPGGRDDARVGAGGERVDHGFGGSTLVGQRPAEHGPQRARILRRGHRSFVEPEQEPLRMCHGLAEPPRARVRDRVAFHPAAQRSAPALVRGMSARRLRSSQLSSPIELLLGSYESHHRSIDSRSSSRVTIPPACPPPGARPEPG